MNTTHYKLCGNPYYAAQPALFNELLELISKYPCSYTSMLKAKGKKAYVAKHPEYVPPYKHLLDWINSSLPQLEDDKYILSTKCYWILNGLTDFPKCQHSGCNKRFMQNVGKHGYNQYCCKQHANSAAQTIEKRKQTCKKRFGTDFPTQAQAIKDKQKATFLKRYGCSTPLICPKCIEKGKKRMLLEHGDENWSNHEKAAETFKRHASEDPKFLARIREKTRRTNIKNGHSPNWTNRKKAKQTRLRNNNGKYFTAEMNQKRKDTISKRRQEIPNYDQKIHDKAMKTNIERYGTPFYFQSEQAKRALQDWVTSHGGTTNVFQTQHAIEKRQQTMEKRYGAKHSLQAESIRAKYDFADISAKGIETKKKHGTFNTSAPEEDAFLKLCALFGKEAVVRQYKSAEYPFCCDFFIVPLSLYIECNYSWTHGGHFYDENSNNDIETLKAWKAKKTKYYENAIDTWTRRDKQKHETAIANKLKYLVFWKPADLEQWIEQFSRGVQYT